ncbi:terminase [Tumebacillus algifaecis]|uniref:Terminase n=1 Tax=Tumebacillus algifaecis TaxID=1214604 RepID=A0A223D264_9BACL|nr:phage terminase large subunit [Tumebacillus algifaecis]ASS75779.1 terminase [Tumebacillus algifaecis]
MTTDRRLQEAKLGLLREKRLRKSRKGFWEFCKTIAPDFYKESRWHLKLIAVVLQALYESQLTKAFFRQACEGIAPRWFIDEYDWSQLQEGVVYRNMTMNIPPRHGKSRTLIMFCEWCFGQDKTNRIITASYNEDMATDFSRYTRDGISEEKIYPHEIVYSDIFPSVRVADGNASFRQWALDGQFFSYKGAGLGGSITGKGGNILIVDDPIKNAEEAFNDNVLDKQWQWYTGTFLSRQEQRDTTFKIVNMTRWSKKDICGRLLAGRGARRWFVLKIPVEDQAGEHMLCEEIFSRATFEELSEEADPLILKANYYQEPIYAEGLLYKSFKTYENVPSDASGHPLFEKIISYTDSADDGADYLCCVIGGVYRGEIYLLDVLYTKAGMEITEPQTADILVRNNVTLADVESNAGGKGFARNVEREIWERHQTRKVKVRWFHQSKNKQARILSNSVFIMNHVYFPVNWRDRWPEYYKAMTEYKKEGGNKHDDAPDATTGLVEMMDVQEVIVETDRMDMSDLAEAY